MPGRCAGLRWVEEELGTPASARPLRPLPLDLPAGFPPQAHVVPAGETADPMPNLSCHMLSSLGSAGASAEAMSLFNKISERLLQR